jgi:uncharacterized protein involved in response to NO
MNARFETSSRYSAAGLTTAAVLIVMVAMAASTLFPEASSAGTSAAAGHSQVAQSHGSRSVKKS